LTGFRTRNKAKSNASANFFEAVVNLQQFGRIATCRYRGRVFGSGLSTGSKTGML
jgi:hypothetical protein